MVDALTNNAWVKDIDHSMSQQIIDEFIQLWEKLEPVALMQLQEDRITWTHSASGEYSAKSSYDLHFQNMSRCSVAELIWKTKAPPKCRFFIWLLLQVRQWPNEYFCQLCVRNLETANHLFVECPVVKSIWHRVGQWAGAPSMQPENWELVENVSEWFVQMMNSLQPTLKEGMRSLIMLTTWEIWRERNSRVFRKVGRQVQRIVESIIDEANTWAHAGNKGLRQVLQLQSEAQAFTVGQPATANAIVVSPPYVIS